MAVPPTPAPARRRSVRAALRRRLLWRWLWEGLDVALVPGCALGLVAHAGGSVGPNAVLGAALVALLLAQGTAYWFGLWRSVAHRDHRTLERVLRGLAPMRVANPVLIGAGTVTIVASAVASGFGSDAAAGLALIAFAALEHVNYYVVQLMHDNRADLGRLRRNRRLRRAHLARDLDRRR